MNSQNSPHFTEHGIPIRNLWHMLLYAWNEPLVQNQVTIGEVESAPTLDALLALVLIKFLQQRMRIGLGRGYVEASKRTRHVKGRINFAESLKQQTFERGEAECDFQRWQDWFKRVSSVPIRRMPKLCVTACAGWCETWTASR
jgi:5-methylcytosine-specific restriction enzyme subunit McrC